MRVLSQFGLPSVSYLPFLSVSSGVFFFRLRSRRAWSYSRLGRTLTETGPTGEMCRAPVGSPKGLRDSIDFPHEPFFNVLASDREPEKENGERRRRRAVIIEQKDGNKKIGELLGDRRGSVYKRKLTL